MFLTRRFSYTFLQRVNYHFSNRCQLNTTNDVSNNTSTLNNEKQLNSSVSWATSDTNGLIKQLSTRIKSSGPITIADYMREALLNPIDVCCLV